MELANIEFVVFFFLLSKTRKCKIVLGVLISLCFFEPGVFFVDFAFTVDGSLIYSTRSTIII
jgi:hypothetical protein